MTTNKGYNFGSQKKLSYDFGKVPGPGEYNGELLKSNRNIKIGQKLQDSRTLQVPGPGVIFNLFRICSEKYY